MLPRNKPFNTPFLKQTNTTALPSWTKPLIPSAVNSVKTACSVHVSLKINRATCPVESIKRNEIRKQKDNEYTKNTQEANVLGFLGIFSYSPTSKKEILFCFFELFSFQNIIFSIYLGPYQITSSSIPFQLQHHSGHLLTMQYLHKMSCQICHKHSKLEIPAGMYFSIKFYQISH